MLKIESTTLLIFLSYILCENTLIIPKGLKNFRLTTEGGIPRLINSSANEETRVRDYANIDSQFLMINMKGAVCDKEDKDAMKCSLEGEKPILAVRSIYTEANLKTPDDKCLTVGSLMEDETYSVKAEKCRKDDEKQLFLLSVEHGPNDKDSVTSKNVGSLTDEQIEAYQKKNKAFA